MPTGIEKEFIKTERAHRIILQILQDRFWPIFELHLGLGPTADLPALRQLHDLILPQLKPDAATIAAVMNPRWVASAKIFYANYCKLYSAAVEAQREALAVNEALCADVAALEQALREEKAPMWKLSDLMAQPFQRLMRYPMLFAELLKQTKGTAAHAAVAASHAAFSALADHCNTEKQEEERRSALLQVVQEAELPKLIENPRHRLSTTGEFGAAGVQAPAAHRHRHQPTGTTPATAMPTISAACVAERSWRVVGRAGGERPAGAAAAAADPVPGARAQRGRRLLVGVCLAGLHRADGGDDAAAERPCAARHAPNRNARRARAAAALRSARCDPRPAR